MRGKIREKSFWEKWDGSTDKEILQRQMNLPVWERPIYAQVYVRPISLYDIGDHNRRLI